MNWPVSGNRLADLLQGLDDRPALYAHGRQASRRELREAALVLAAQWSSLGLRRGDAVALWLPNGLSWMQCLFAASHLGILIVPVSTRYKPPEVRHVLEVSKARALVVPRDFLDADLVAIAHELKAVVPTLEWVIEQLDANDFLPGLDAARFAPGPVNEDDLLACFSTSGTTGHPKLAAHGQGSIVRHAVHVSKALDFHEGDCLLAVLPMFGVFGFMAVLAAFAGGASVVVMPVFEAQPAVRDVENHRVTHIIGADSMFDAMFRIEGADLSSWRRGVMADFVGLPLEVARRGDELGIAFTGTYGSSECYSLMSFNDWQAGAEQRAKAGGLPVDRAIEVRIVEPDGDRLMPEGEAGEIQIRGPNVLAGYLNNPEATAKAFTSDGWFRSGDLGYREGGCFVYLARLGDSLRLRGYLVNPAEIENCLMQHAAVAGAQVVGVRQAGRGDVAIAWVLAAGSPDEFPAEAELLAHCRANIASYKVPLRVVRIDAFPAISGPNGTKIQKRRLREMAQALLA